MSPKELTIMIAAGLVSLGAAWWIAQDADGISEQESANTSPSPTGDSLFVDLNTTTASNQRSQPPVSLPPNPGLETLLKDFAAHKAPSRDQINELRSTLTTNTPAELATICSWARQLDRESPSTFVILHEALSAWTKSDPAGALDEFVELARSDQEWLDLGLPIAIKPALKNAAGETWQSLNRRNILADLPDVEHQLLRKWALDDPQAAANAITELTRSRDLPSNAQAATVVANQLWKQNPDQTVDWIFGLPNDSLAAQQALSTVMDRWLETKPTDAIAWLSDCEASPLRDAGITALVANLELTDIELAARWATELSDESSRQRNLLRVLRQIQSSNPALSDRILKNRDLIPEAEATNLHNALNPPTTDPSHKEG